MNQALSPELIKVMKELEDRDAKDALTGQELQGEMLASGFSVYETTNDLEIDTGTNGGIDNTIATIVVSIAKIPNCRLITIEGLSGTGKTTASVVLADRIGGCCISTGEIFRYLALQKMLHPSLGVKSVLKEIKIVANSSRAELFGGELNISKKYAKEFRRSDIEKMSSILGATCQLPVISFLHKEVERLRQVESRVLIMEGRSYNMVYFPADLRIRLKADILIRAKKRLNQWK